MTPVGEGGVTIRSGPAIWVSGGQTLTRPPHAALRKTFHRSTNMDDRLTSLALACVKSACVRNLEYNYVIDEVDCYSVDAFKDPKNDEGSK